MIMLTRHNGSRFALNPDLIEKAEETPDTVIALVGGTRYIVAESLDQVIEEICAFRAAILRAADTLAQPPSPVTVPRLRSLPDRGH